MKNFHNAPVAIGDGARNIGALHRAWAVASELYATWKWDGRGRIVIHAPYETHTQMQCSQKLGYSRRGSTNVHAGVHTLAYGEHYEIKPLAVEACRRLDIDEDRALSAEEAERVQVTTKEPQHVWAPAILDDTRITPSGRMFCPKCGVQLTADFKVRHNRIELSANVDRDWIVFDVGEAACVETELVNIRCPVCEYEPGEIETCPECGMNHAPGKNTLCSQ
jgi:hypothetical protein